MDPAEIAVASPSSRYRVTALIVASALFMEQLDGTVLATALPSIAHSFNSNPVRLNIALTAYLLSLAVLIPASGRLADRFGARTVFRVSIALFTAGSILCGQANSVVFLVLARLTQGVGGAMMVPVGRLILLRTTPKSELVSAMAWLLVPATLGPMLGPPLGGLITTYLSWRWIFWINVPVGLAGIILTSRYIAPTPPEARLPLDIPGIALSGAALSCVMFGLELLGRGEAPRLGMGLTTAGVVLGVLYARYSRNQRAPVVDARLLDVQTFGLSVLSGSCFRVAIGAIPFLLPLMLQVGFGLSAAASGAITFASSLGSLAMRLLAKPILKRVGYRMLLSVNGVIGMALLAIVGMMRPSWPWPLLYGLLGIMGFFQSLQFTAYNTIAYADMPAHRMSAATSFYSTFQQLSLSLGITVAAGALTLFTSWSGEGKPAPFVFTETFWLVSAIGLLAAPAALRLSPEAGQEVSGHLVRRRPSRAEPVVNQG